MLIFGIIEWFIIGLLLVSRLSINLSWIEKIGLSFPVGAGISTFLFLLMDWVGVPLNSGNMMLFVTILLIGCIGLQWPLRKNWYEKFRFVKPDWRQYNGIWLVCIGCIIWAEYANYTKCMFFPTYDRDSMAGFDTIGYVIAQENTLKGLSLFSGDYVSWIHKAGSYMAYTPMIQLGYAYLYSLGAETSKLMPALMYLSFLFSFYGFIARRAGKTAGALATLFMMITPEMLAFSSLSGTNVMHAVTAAMGLLYICSWWLSKDSKELNLAILLLAINGWCRAEGIVFILTAGLLILIRTIRERHWTWIGIAAMTFIPIVTWSLFMKTSGMEVESTVITQFFYDGEKLDKVVNGFIDLFFNPVYYGWTFKAFLLLLIVNIYFIIKKRDSAVIPFAILFSLVAYAVVLYQVNYTWDRIENVLAYSAKRFFFCFVPVIWYYIVSNYAVRFLLNKTEKALRS